MHVAIKDLSTPVRDALKSVGYGAADIEIIPCEGVEVAVAGGSGQRGFTIAVNLDNGARKSFTGSWGGENMFSQNPVDSSPEIVAIPENGIVIKGTTGYPRTFAWIYAHPNAVGAHLLPSGEPTDELSAEDQQAIYCFAAIKGGEYRRDEMRRRGVSTATVDSLVDRGYLKRSRNGATQITTAGKNARTIRN